MPPLGTAWLAACLLMFPLMTWKIIAGIHWAALKLWLKGTRFRSINCRDQAMAFEPGE
ncbi:DUF1365 family protein [Mesorhizobium sp. P5_C1]